MFKIKVKTKSGNDISKPQYFTIIFEAFLKKNLLTKVNTGIYTYRVNYGNRIFDTKSVFRIKSEIELKSDSDLIIKCIVNLLYISQKLSIKYNMNLDKIFFISKSFNRNRIWFPLVDIFKKYTKNEEIQIGEHRIKTIQLTDKQGIDSWDKDKCSKFGIKYDDLKLIQDFATKNKDVDHIVIDPTRDPIKRAKSLFICSSLENRLKQYNFSEDPNQVKLVV